MFEGHHYQNAYITRNIDKAIAEFKTRSGVEKVLTFEGEVQFTTPKGLVKAVNKLAFIWINNLQYELIQPVSGACDIYRDELPADDRMKFHHSCTRIADWDSFRARVAQQGYSVVMEGGGDQLKYIYIDARDVVGHYLEYVWCTPERWTQMGGK